MRLSADLDEGVVRALGLKAHPTGFVIMHVLKDDTLIEDETGRHYADPTVVGLEISPDLDLDKKGTPVGYADMLSALGESSDQAKHQ